MRHSGRRKVQGTGRTLAETLAKAEAETLGEKLVDV